jgi:hypothetical protein
MPHPRAVKGVKVPCYCGLPEYDIPHFISVHQRYCHLNPTAPNPDHNADEEEEDGDSNDTIIDHSDKENDIMDIEEDLVQNDRMEDDLFDGQGEFCQYMRSNCSLYIIYRSPI